MDISIIGTGNVAHHLAKAIHELGDYYLISITGTSRAKAKNINLRGEIKRLSSIADIPNSDLVIICVGDKSIPKVSKEVAKNKSLKSSIICHTSGSISSDVLSKHKQYGVFYPLQTFSKKRDLQFSEIPICLTANKKSVLKKLKPLASALSSDVRLLTDAQRKQVHMSAVVANNLVNHLIYLAKARLTKQDIDASILDALIKETASKLSTTSALEAQTGPARRNDKNVIADHLKGLAQEPDLLSIYKVITKSITKTYKQKK